LRPEGKQQTSHQHQRTQPSGEQSKPLAGFSGWARAVVNPE